MVSPRIPPYFLLAAAFFLSALAAAVPRDDPDVGDGIDVQPFLEPTNTTIWRPNTTARIAWITNATDPNAMLPVHYEHPLAIRLWKLTNGSALGELPVVFSEVAYRDDGSVNVTVPFLEEGDGFIVTVRTNTTDHRTWYSSEQFTVQRGDD